MESKRYVPFTMGTVTLVGGLWLAIAKGGVWIFVASFLVLFGWVSLKTAIFASNKEIDELTSPGPASEDTIKKFEDRLR